MVSEGFKLIARSMDIAVKDVRQMYTKTFKKNDIDLTIEQWPIMAVIYDFKVLTQIEIAQKIMRFPQSLSASIKLLINKGYIARTKSDKDFRSFDIYLTPKGKEMVENAFPLVRRLRVKQWENLSEEDYEQFMKIISQIKKNVK
jgi:DNA-binding MarR family transcriptional regulator